MKTILTSIALVTGIFIFSGCDNGKTNTDSAKMATLQQDTMDHKISREDRNKMNDGMSAVMNSMMDKMSAMKMTGDFDIDFANMMIEHHQGAIDMSEAEIRSGTDTKLKAMAQNIITKQKEEQTKLKAIVKNSQPMKMDMGQGDELHKDMNDRKAKMDAMKMTGNTDKDFAMMMMSHHEAAIKMAKAELSYGMKAALKQMAKNMISDQTKEISEFTNWLSANK